MFSGDEAHLTTKQIPEKKSDLVILVGHGGVAGGVKQRGTQQERGRIDIFDTVKDTAQVVSVVKDKMNPETFVIVGCHEAATRKSLEDNIANFNPGTTFIIPSSSKHVSEIPMNNDFVDRLIEESKDSRFDVVTFTAKESVRSPESLVFMRVIQNAQGKNEMVVVKFISPKHPDKSLMLPTLDSSLRSYFTTTALYDINAPKGNKMHQDAHMVIMSGADHPVVQELIEKRTEAGVVAMPGGLEKYAGDALRLSVMRGKTERVDHWSAKGADIDRQSSFGTTPLALAIIEKHTDVALKLIEKGANINAQVNTGETPLHLATAMNQPDVVLKLIEKGVDINACNAGGETALHWAIETGNSDIALELINARADLSQTNNLGVTPLYKAIAQGETKIASAIIKAKPDLNQLGSHKMTALDYAIETGNSAIAHELLEAGINLNNKASDGKTPLQRAILRNRMEIVSGIIARGADLNEQETFKNTPLHFAAAVGNVKATSALIEAGADLDIINSDGRTALYVALMFSQNEDPTKYIDIALKLIEKGADLTIPANILEGQPPITGMQLIKMLAQSGETRFLLAAEATIQKKAEAQLIAQASAAPIEAKDMSASDKAELASAGSALRATGAAAAAHNSAPQQPMSSPSAHDIDNAEVKRS